MSLNLVSKKFQIMPNFVLIIMIEKKIAIINIIFSKNFEIIFKNDDFFAIIFDMIILDFTTWLLNVLFLKSRFEKMVFFI